MKLWKTIAVAAAVLLAAGSAARARRRRRRTSSSASAAAPALYYLPLALTEKLGYFKEQGLNVEVNDFKGGSQSLTALVGGSADVVTGAYEHTLRMQAKGQEILAVIELGRYPGIALGGEEGPRRQDQDDRRPQGRQDRRHRARLLHQHDRLVPDGQGGPQARRRLLHRRRRAALGAIAAIQKGEIDAISNIDPVIAKLQSTNDVVVLAETRTTEGTTKVFGGPMSAAVLYLKRDFMEKNPNTVQALVNAFYKTLDVAGQGDARADRRQRAAGILAGRQGALHRRREGQPAGLLARRHRQRRAARSARSISSSQFDKEIAAATIDTAKTWDGRFVKKAAATIK